MINIIKYDVLHFIMVTLERLEFMMKSQGKYVLSTLSCECVKTLVKFIGDTERHENAYIYELHG